MTERQSEATRESAERWSQLREELCAMHTEQKETAVHQSEMFTVLRQQSGEELRTVRDEAQQAQDKVKHLDMALEEALKRAEEESKIADDKLKERVTHENADTVAIQAQITSYEALAAKQNESTELEVASLNNRMKADLANRRSDERVPGRMAIFAR